MTYNFQHPLQRLQARLQLPQPPRPLPVPECTPARWRNDLLKSKTLDYKVCLIIIVIQPLNTPLLQFQIGFGNFVCYIFSFCPGRFLTFYLSSFSVYTFFYFITILQLDYRNCNLIYSPRHRIKICLNLF